MISSAVETPHLPLVPRSGPVEYIGLAKAIRAAVLMTFLYLYTEVQAFFDPKRVQPNRTNVEKTMRAARHALLDQLPSPRAALERAKAHAVHGMAGLNHRVSDMRRNVGLGLVSALIALAVPTLILFVIDRNLALNATMNLHQVVSQYGSLIAAMKTITVQGVLNLVFSGFLENELHGHIPELASTLLTGFIGIAQGGFSMAVGLSSLGLATISAGLATAAPIVFPILITISSIGYAIMNGAQLYRSTKMLNLLENPDHRPPLELLNDLLPNRVNLASVIGGHLVKVITEACSRENLQELFDLSDSEVEEFAKEKQISLKEAEEILKIQKKASELMFSSYFGEELLARAKSGNLTSVEFGPRLLKEAEHAAYKTTVVKKIGIGLALLGGLGSALALPTYGASLILTAFVTGYAIANLASLGAVNDKICDYFWKKREAKKQSILAT